MSIERHELEYYKQGQVPASPLTLIIQAWQARGWRWQSPVRLQAPLLRDRAEASAECCTQR